MTASSHREGIVSRGTKGEDIGQDVKRRSLDTAEGPGQSENPVQLHHGTLNGKCDHDLICWDQSNLFSRVLLALSAFPSAQLSVTP